MAAVSPAVGVLARPIVDTGLAARDQHPDTPVGTGSAKLLGEMTVSRVKQAAEPSPDLNLSSRPYRPVRTNATTFTPTWRASSCLALVALP